MKPAVRSVIKITAWISSFWSKNRMRGTHYHWRIAIKSVMVQHTEQRFASSIVHIQGAVDRFQYVAVAHAQSLIRRLKGELIAVVRQPLLTCCNAIKTDRKLWTDWQRPTSTRRGWRKRSAVLWA